MLRVHKHHLRRAGAASQPKQSEAEESDARAGALAAGSSAGAEPAENEREESRSSEDEGSKPDVKAAIAGNTRKSPESKDPGGPVKTTVPLVRKDGKHVALAALQERWAPARWARRAAQDADARNSRSSESDVEVEKLEQRQAVFESDCSFTSLYDKLEAYYATYQRTTRVAEAGEDQMWVDGCLFTVGAMEAYAYSWDDVPPEEQAKARQRAFDDYDSTRSWERGTEKVWSEVPKGKRLTGTEAKKAKMVDGKLTGRLRWTPRGFEQRKVTEAGERVKLRKAEVESPTAHKVTHRTMDVCGQARGWVKFCIDFSEAFFHSETLPADEELWVEVPGGDTRFEWTQENSTAWEAYQRGERVARRLLREVPGTKGAPRAWWSTLMGHLVEIGCLRSKNDPCLVFIPTWGTEEKVRGDTSPWDGYAAIHIDDMMGRATRPAIAWLEQALLTAGFPVKLQIVEVGESFEYVGERCQELSDGFLIDQFQYCDQKLEEVKLGNNRWKRRDAECTDEEVSSFRTGLGSASWVTGRTRPEVQYETSAGATAVNALRIRDVLRLNKAIRVLKDPRWRYALRVPKIDISNGVRLVGIADCGEGEQRPGSWEKCQGGRCVGLMSMAPVGTEGSFAPLWINSGKLSRVTHSSFDGETINVIETVDMALAIESLLEEVEYGVQPGRRTRIEGMRDGVGECGPVARAPIPIEMHTDSKSLVDRVGSRKLDAGMSKRRKQDVADLQELTFEGQMRDPLFHCSGTAIPMDPLTKPANLAKKTSLQLRMLLEEGYYRPESA